MRKKNMFIFFTLLPIVIQAQDLDFDFLSKSLFELHNNEHIFRHFKSLTLDPVLSSNAMELASKMINKTINDCEKPKGINEFWHKKQDYPLTPEIIFKQWLSDEEDTSNNKESIVCPAKITSKDTTLIGIGHATLNNETVFVALYEPYNEEC